MKRLNCKTLALLSLLIAVFLLDLLFGVIVVLTPRVQASGITGSQPPATGDWIVNKTTVVDGMRLTVNGSILMQDVAGISLTIKNSDVIVRGGINVTQSHWNHNVTVVNSNLTINRPIDGPLDTPYLFLNNSLIRVNFTGVAITYSLRGWIVNTRIENMSNNHFQLRLDSFSLLENVTIRGLGYSGTGLLTHAKTVKNLTIYGSGESAIYIRCEKVSGGTWRNIKVYNAYNVGMQIANVNSTTFENIEIYFANMTVTGATILYVGRTGIGPVLNCTFRNIYLHGGYGPAFPHGGLSFEAGSCNNVFYNVTSLYNANGIFEDGGGNLNNTFYGVYIDHSIDDALDGDTPGDITIYNAVIRSGWLSWEGNVTWRIINSTITNILGSKFEQSYIYLINSTISTGSCIRAAALYKEPSPYGSYNTTAQLHQIWSFSNGVSVELYSDRNHNIWKRTDPTAIEPAEIPILQPATMHGNSLTFSINASAGKLVTVYVHPSQYKMPTYVQIDQTIYTNPQPTKAEFDSYNGNCWFYDQSANTIYIKAMTHSPISIYINWNPAYTPAPTPTPTPTPQPTITPTPTIPTWTPILIITLIIVALYIAKKRR